MTTARVQPVCIYIHILQLFHKRTLIFLVTFYKQFSWVDCLSVMTENQRKDQENLDLRETKNSRKERMKRQWRAATETPREILWYGEWEEKPAISGPQSPCDCQDGFSPFASEEMERHGPLRARTHSDKARLRLGLAGTQSKIPTMLWFTAQMWTIPATYVSCMATRTSPECWWRKGSSGRNQRTISIRNALLGKETGKPGRENQGGKTRVGATGGLRGIVTKSGRWTIVESHPTFCLKGSDVS